MGKNKQKKRAMRRPFETGGFLVMMTFVPIMPRRMVIGLSRLAGHLAMLLPLREKKIGMKNIDAVFGNSKTPTEKRRILRSSFSTFCLTMLDVFWFAKHPEKRIARFVDFEDGPIKDELLADKPAICITAHIGSWEVMGQTASLLGANLASIAATVKNPVVDRMLIEQRGRTGQVIIPQKGALRTLIARFRNKGKAAFVLDQKTSEQDGGIYVDFLGLPMPVSSAPAALAYRTGTDILFGFCLPSTGGRYHMRMSERITPPAFDREADADAVIHQLTRQIMDIVSEEIRKNPQFWLWSYKHWRRQKGRTYPDNYPTY
ncbi:MAG: lysophospholipid acyltransferase family protein [Pontiellaceae bacterium]|nr:lysophospholipid acyltransferase family protein [Pontiellaceae bacterium]MBN2783982.1 lysophospholipid acyltransferase family protein [Pontiellaceae bacterium]